MKQVMVQHQRLESIPDDGMLFVRTPSILTTMARVPLIVIGLIAVSLAMPVHNSFSSTKTLDLTIYPDGSTHVFSEILADPLEPDFTLNLFGTTIDNFIAKDENGLLLSNTLEGNSATIETFGASHITVNYDTHDLVSKEGRIWSFNIDTTSEYTLLMPKNIVIVGMSTFPLNMQIINEQSQISLPSGPAEINYFFGTPTVEPTPTEPESTIDTNMIMIIGLIAVGAAAAAIAFMKKSRSTKTLQTIDTKTIQTSESHLDTETIFEHKPDLRDDDKELIKFISNNGGKALESELRKKFLQPRTTMWRAVKRLEREGIIEIEKKDLQNLVKLKNKLGDDEQ